MHRLSVSLIAVGAGVLFVAVMVNLLGAHKPKHRVKEITLTGNIDWGYNYFVEVHYFSSLDTLACTSYSFFAGRTKSFKELTYYPKVESGKHVISFPINELSPNRGCNWLPSYVRLCVMADSDPENGSCSTLFNIGESNTTSRGIPIYANSSSADRPLKIKCEEGTYDPAQWWCSYVPPPEDNGKSTFSRGLIIFPGVTSGNFPMDRNDVYWLDINFSPAEH